MLRRIESCFADVGVSISPSSGVVASVFMLSSSFALSFSVSL